VYLKRRQDLLRLFPEAAERAVTIHNMVSHHYFKEDANPERVPGIVRARLHEGDKGKGVSVQPDFLSLREMEGFYRRVLGKRPFRLAGGLHGRATQEPRPTSGGLGGDQGGYRPRPQADRGGGLGWDYATMLKGFRPWIEQGDLFMLNAVPA
jgi:hypothetical protein